jgi:hypothetical protein
MSIPFTSSNCTQSGNNTAQSSWDVAHAAGNTGDLRGWVVTWDDSVTTTNCAAPPGPNGETLIEMNATPVSANPVGGNAARGKAWYTIATGSWAAGSLAFTPTASEQWSATSFIIPAGQFDPASPISAILTRQGPNAADTEALTPAGSAGASDGGGKLFWFPFVNSSGLTTLDAGWTEHVNQDVGAIAHGLATRDTDVTNSETFAEASWDIAVADAWGSISFVVRAPSGSGFSMSVDAGSLALSGEVVNMPFTAEYSIPVTHAPMALEGQEVPFILTQPGPDTELALEGSDIVFLTQLVAPVDAGALALQGYDVGLLQAATLQVDAAQLVLGQGDITLAATGVAATASGQSRRRGKGRR